MLFGLRNAPATFIRLVRKLLLGLDVLCTAYLYDIIIFTDTREEDLSHLRIVLSRIRAANLIFAAMITTEDSYFALDWEWDPDVSTEREPR